MNCLPAPAMRGLILPVYSYFLRGRSFRNRQSCVAAQQDKSRHRLHLRWVRHATSIISQNSCSLAEPQRRNYTHSVREARTASTGCGDGLVRPKSPADHHFLSSRAPSAARATMRSIQSRNRNLGIQNARKSAKTIVRNDSNAASPRATGASLATRRTHGSSWATRYGMGLRRRRAS